MNSGRIDWSEYHRLLEFVGSERYCALPERERKAFLIGSKAILDDSDWFRVLNEADRKAVLTAFRYDTMKSANKIRAALTFVHLIAAYGVAFFIWALALDFRIFWFLIAGTIVGTIIGGLSASVISSQRTITGGKDMQFVSGIFLVLGALLGVAGLAVWLVRVLLFY